MSNQAQEPKKLTAQEIREALANMTPEEISIITGADIKKLKREEYENSVDEVVTHVVKECTSFSELMRTLKVDIAQRIQVFIDQARKYAELNGNYDYKGSKTLFSKDKLTKVMYAIGETYQYDARADEAELLLKEYVQSLMKEDPNVKILHELLSSILERNSRTGKLDPRQVQKLYRFETEIQDNRFQRALELFKESYQSISSKSYIRVYKRTDLQAKWEQIPLDFAAV